MRKLSDFKYCADRFEYYMDEYYFSRARMNVVHINKLRCAFFDWLFDVDGYFAIIGTFIPSGQSYYEAAVKAGSSFKFLNLECSEVQVCVSEKKQACIIEKRILAMDDVNPITGGGFK